MKGKEIIGGSDRRSQSTQVETLYSWIRGLRIGAKLRTIVAKRDQFFISSESERQKGESGARSNKASAGPSAHIKM